MQIIEVLLLKLIEKFWNQLLSKLVLYSSLFFSKILDSSVKWSLRTLLQAREKTNKRFHGAIPKLLHSIKHSCSKADPFDVELHHVRRR